MDCGIRRRVEARMQIVLSGDWYFPPLKIYISVDDCYERTGAGPVVTGISKQLQSVPSWKAGDVSSSEPGWSVSSRPSHC